MKLIQCSDKLHEYLLKRKFALRLNSFHRVMSDIIIENQRLKFKNAELQEKLNDFPREKNLITA